MTRRINEKVLVTSVSKILMKKYVFRTFYRKSEGRDVVIGLFKWNKKKGIFEPFEVRIRGEIRELFEHYAGYIASGSVVNSTINEIKDKTLTLLSEDPLRISFPNATLEWTIGENGYYMPKFIPAEERTPEHFAFNYIPHKIRLDELAMINEEARKKGEITIDMLEGLAQRICPRSLKAFKEWVGEKWVLLFEIIGYTLFPAPIMKKAIMFVDRTDIAKELLQKLLGKENIAYVGVYEKNKLIISTLYHALANITYYGGALHKLNGTNIFRILTDGDPIKAHVKFKGSFTFVPYAKLIIMASRPPHIRGEPDKELLSRWIIIPFQIPSQFSYASSNTYFGQVFTEEELEGILTVSILAFTRVLRNGKFDFEQVEEEIKDELN